ncbi:MAG: hypothetical protein EZS28_039808, partial [Streblomastix strix]
KLHQSRDKVELKPYYRYLCIKIKECTDMIAADTTGYSDVFVVVDWDGARQMTRVIPENLNPQFNEYLYIPVRMGGSSVSRSQLQKKGNIKISCFDYDEAGNDFLGSVEVPLSKITSANQITDPIDANAETRVYTPSNGLLLTSGGQPTSKNSKIFVSCFFHPDFPSRLHLDPPEALQKLKIPERFIQRASEWRESVPKYMTSQSPYEISATNDESNDFFLPCFLTRNIALPKPLRHPRLLMRMVHAMTFAADAESFQGFAMADKRIFMSPPFILSIRKGDDQDHSILLCSLLLSMGVDAYLCLGTAKSTGQPHVWVITREFDGTVMFWETTRGLGLACKLRWKGSVDCPPDYVLYRNELLGLKAPVAPLVAEWREWKEEQSSALAIAKKMGLGRLFSSGSSKEQKKKAKLVQQKQDRFEEKQREIDAKRQAKDEKKKQKKSTEMMNMKTEEGKAQAKVEDRIIFYKD